MHATNPTDYSIKQRFFAFFNVRVVLNYPENCIVFIENCYLRQAKELWVFIEFSVKYRDFKNLAKVHFTQRFIGFCCINFMEFLKI